MLSYIFPITKNKVRTWERKGKILKLINALIKGNFEIRANAAQALGNLGDKRALAELIKHLDDTFRNVRNESARAILKIDSSDSMKILIEEKTNFWNEISENIKNSKPKNQPDEFDKDFYSWKGRFKRNITMTKAIKEKLKRPMRWG